MSRSTCPFTDDAAAFPSHGAAILRKALAVLCVFAILWAGLLHASHFSHADAGAGVVLSEKAGEADGSGDHPAPGADHCHACLGVVLPAMNSASAVQPLSGIVRDNGEYRITSHSPPADFRPPIAAL